MFSGVWRRSARSLLIGAGCLSGSAYVLHTQKLAYASVQKAKAEQEDLCLYLAPESRTLLSRHLDSKFGIALPSDAADTHALGREVVLKPRMNAADSYIYRPLYGERAAFRLKGLITTSQGDVVGIGRVSNMTGELFDEEYEASILLKTDAPAAESGRARRELLRDLPTRLYQSVALSEREGGGSSSSSSKSSGKTWKGPLGMGDVLGKAYPQLDEVKVRTLTLEEQIVLDGRVCGSTCADPSTGTCDFDRSAVVDDVAPDSLTERKMDMSRHANAAHLEQRRNAQINVEDKGSAAAASTASTAATVDPAAPEQDREKCPVCRYMKGGPCREQFISWDACIQNLKDGDDVRACYEPTTVMMACMQQHEYYDPMTSNSRTA